MIMFQKEIPRIYLQTDAERIAAFPLNGCPAVAESTGGSVERAIAAKVSMTKLIQRSCTALNGDSARNIPPTIMVRRQEILTVI